MFSYTYAIIDKATSQCIQVVSTNVPNWSMDDSKKFSVEVHLEYAFDLVNKYFHSGKWWNRVYNQYETVVETDEDGNVLFERKVPIEESGYTETEFIKL